MVYRGWLRACGGVAFAVVAASVVLACSQGPVGATEARLSSDLQVCVLDGAVCVDLPDADLPILPFDAGLPDVQLPPLPPLPPVNLDGGFPFPSFEAGLDICDLANPQYLLELEQSLSSGPPTPCGSCVATQCCALGVTCVAK